MELSLSLLLTLILFGVTVGIFWMSLNLNSSKAQPDVDNISASEKTCNADDDCLSDPKGSKCLVIYPSEFSPFCGCLTDNDCSGGICGSDNKCI